jgi:hypothetical protein
LKKLDYFRSRFYWQGDEQKKKYISPSGVFYVNQKIKEVLAYMIWVSRTQLYLANGCLSFLRQMELGSKSSEINI